MNFENIEPLPVKCRQSCIACAYACKRLWYYKYRLGVTLRGAEYKQAATIGKIYHRLQQFGQGNEDKVKAEIRGQQKELMGAVQRGEDLDGNMQRLATNLTALYNKAEVMAHIFWEKFPQPDYLKVIGTEIKHSVEWNGLIIEGTIDKLLYDEKGGGVWIRDHKSTGRPLSVIFGGLAWSVQARIYRILALDYLKKHRELGYDDVPVRGFILDGIITPGIKLCKTDMKNSKDWNCSVEDAYLRRVEDWYRTYEVKAEIDDKANTKALDSRGIIYTEPLFSHELVEALENMETLSKRAFKEPELFPRDITRQACFQYEKQCIYHDLCETDPKQWDSLFETKYQIKPEEDKKDVDENTV